MIPDSRRPKPGPRLPSSDTWSRALGNVSFYQEILDDIRGDLVSDQQRAREAATRLGMALSVREEPSELSRVVKAGAALQDAASGEIATLIEAVDRLGAVLQDVQREQKPATALIVENDPTTARSMRDALEASGFWTVLHATTAEEARHRAAEQTVDAIVLEMVLPDEDGRTLLFDLRRRPGLGEIPIVVLSSVQAAGARAECFAYGADAFLRTPVDLETLTSTLSRPRRRSHREGLREDLLLRLSPRSQVSASFDRLQERRRRDGFPMAVALIEAEPSPGGADADDAGIRLIALLRDLVRTLGPHLAPRDILGRWSVNDLVLVSLSNDVPELASLLSAVKRELAWPDDGFYAGITEPTADAGFMDAVSAAGLLLVEARRGEKGGICHDVNAVGLERTVVLAEDDPITAALVLHRLERSGLVVRHFVNGAEAFQSILEDPPTLAVLDVQMPGMDGFELLSRMKYDERTRHVRTIVFTAMGSEADIARGFRLGADDFIVKPFSPRELLARVLRLVHD